MTGWIQLRLILAAWWGVQPYVCRASVPPVSRAEPRPVGGEQEGWRVYSQRVLRWCLD